MGLDIGGTGMKAGLVETATGELQTDRIRLPTPRPATPDAMLQVVRQLRDELEWSGPIGAAFPGVVRSGQICTAANVDRSWIGVDAVRWLSEELGQPVSMINDADAAGVAEVRLGPAELSVGTTMMCTLGTGIGTALFVDGRLVPNTELGHLDLGGTEAEALASGRARDEQDLGWEEWGGRVQTFLFELERLLWPDRFVIGGGVSKKFDKFSEYLVLSTPVRAASLRNRAGVVGAALSYVDSAP